ncbi:MAG: tetratricopeptide repeat protein [Chloroflexota bacterium]
MDRLRAVITALENNEPSPELSILHSKVARLSWGMWELDAVGDAAAHALRIAEAAGDESALVEAETWQGLWLSEIGRDTEALVVFGDAITQAESSLPGSAPYIALVCAGESCLRLGQFLPALDYWKRAFTVRERTGGPDTVSFDLANLAEVQTLLGNWKDARAAVERGVSIEARRNVSWTSTYPTLLAGSLEFLEGNVDAAEQLASEGLVMAERTHDAQGLHMARKLLGQVEWRRGRTEAALALLTPLLSDPQTPNPQTAFAAPLVIEALLDIGAVEQAGAMAAEAVEQAIRRNHELALVDLLRARGLVLRRQGLREDAGHAFEASVTLARQMPYPYAEARALHVWGEMLITDGAKQEGLTRLGEALTIFQRLGARLDSEETEQAMTALSETINTGGR